MKKFRYRLIILEFFMWGILWVTPLGNFVYINDSVTPIQKTQLNIAFAQNTTNSFFIVTDDNGLTTGRIDPTSFNFNNGEKEKKEYQTNLYIPFRSLRNSKTRYFLTSDALTGNKERGVFPHLQLQI